MRLNLDKNTWTQVAFGDVVRNVNNTTKDPNACGIERVIAMEHMDPGELKIDRWGNVAEGTTFTRLVTPGQTLFGKRRAYQRKVAFAEFEAVCSGDIYTFEAVPDALLPELLPFLVQSERFFAHALGTSAGSLSPRTNWRDLSNFKFYLPPLDEQQRIASLLWTIEFHRYSVANQLHVTRRSIEAMYSEFTSHHAFHELHEWVRNVEAGSSPRGASTPATGGKLGVLKVSSIGSHSFLPEENKELLRDSDFRNDRSVRAGDVLITRANASIDRVAHPCLVSEDHPNLMLSDKTLRLNLKSDIPPRVLLAALRSRTYRKYVTSVTSGTEAKNISQAKILAGPVPILTSDEASSLDSLLSDAEQAIEYINLETRALSDLRTTLINDIFGDI